MTKTLLRTINEKERLMAKPIGGMIHLEVEQNINGEWHELDEEQNKERCGEITLTDEEMKTIKQIFASM